MELFNVLFRTIFFYLFVLISFRIMGKREIGQLGVIDLIISIMIAELVSISIENTNDSIFLTVIPITLLVVLEILFAYISIKSRRFRDIFDGKPSLIISNGKINYREMVKQRYSLDDLLISLRMQGIKDLDNVEYALLEPNGKLSVFKYNIFKIRGNYPMPLILDGETQLNTLKHIKKNETWLEEKLAIKDLRVEDVFYAFYKNDNIYIIKKSKVK